LELVRLTRFVAFMCVGLSLLLAACAGIAHAQLFETKAKQAFMIDADTGTVLFSKDPDTLFPPGVARQADDDGSRVQRHQGSVADA
jgi:D-alanyl-D-alanine carboxypeptidase